MELMGRPTMPPAGGGSTFSVAGLGMPPSVKYGAPAAVIGAKPQLNPPGVGTVVLTPLSVPLVAAGPLPALGVSSQLFGSFGSDVLVEGVATFDVPRVVGEYAVRAVSPTLLVPR